MKLYVVGGRQRPNAADLDEWHRYEAGVVAELDCERGSAQLLHAYESSADVLPVDGGSVVFKAATLRGRRLYACTQTEVLVYALPGFECVARIDCERFNDVHHVRPRADGSFLVANTGLDSLLHLGADGELIREWPVLPEGEAPGFAPGIDYRRVVTTKPHKSHPNYTFELDGRIWATRFEQRDAVCVEDLSQRIALGAERPHDGVEHQGELYFTMVDGRVVVVDVASRSVVRSYDLNTMAEHGGALGWCRGIHVVARDQVLVGFSRIRLTSITQNLRWLASRALGREVHSFPTRVAHFDLARGALVAEWDVESAGVNALFSIHPVE